MSEIGGSKDANSAAGVDAALDTTLEDGELLSSDSEGHEEVTSYHPPSASSEKSTKSGMSSNKRKTSSRHRYKTAMTTTFNLIVRWFIKTVSLGLCKLSPLDM